MGNETDERIIHVDYSILSTFQTCEEKARLAYQLHLKPRGEVLALSFGHAIHAGIAEFYRLGKSLAEATVAFLNDLRDQGSKMGLEIEGQDKRSIERGLNLLEAYVERWRDEPYEVAKRGDEPLIEVGFSFLVGTFDDHDVLMVGRFDRAMRSLTDGRAYTFETKTTSGSLYSLNLSVRPNHQATTYHYAYFLLTGEKLAGTVFDGIYVSDRQPNEKKGGWMAKGVDIEKDFGRFSTLRSDVDVSEWSWDVHETVKRYVRRVLESREKMVSRWTRNAPTACTMYGGCRYRDLCATNLNPQVMETNFKVKPWEPWKGAMGAEE